MKNSSVKSGQIPLRFRLDEDATLENYVGSAAVRIAGLRGNIFLTGESGSGKSHLLQGCCHAALKAGQTAIYLPSLADLQPDVLEGLESYSLVCLDDIDRVLGDDQWQQALFHLVNAVQDQPGRLILASATAVGAVQATLPDLLSRLKSCYLLSTDTLPDTSKLRVVRLKAKRRGFDISEDVCRFILGRARRDMHHLMHLVEQLDVETLRRQKKITIPFVKDALGL